MTLTTAPAGRAGTTGAAAGVVPWVMTSGWYTLSFPVAGSRIVAWTKAPRLAALAIVQPDCCGVMPFDPVSWYGVASPWAVSGLAGTTSEQLTLAAAAAAGAVADAGGLAAADGAADPPGLGRAGGPAAA